MEWKMYLAYLHSWADAHADAEFEGMTPVCYDEWLGNDYDNDEEEDA